MAETLFLYNCHQKPSDNTELGVRSLGVGVLIVVGLLSVYALIARFLGVVGVVVGSLGVG